MSWTAPRTWSNGEVNTAAQFNAHIRDNEAVLKVTRNAAGRLTNLSTTTLADLTAENLTGLAMVAAAGISWTNGTTRFTGAGRVVIPVGADKYAVLPFGRRHGFWVEGDYLHHIARDNVTEYHYLGEYVSTPAGARPGSVWIEGQYFHYIDEDGDERRCLSGGATGHSDAAAEGGSAWVETYVHWIRETGALELPGHADVAHADGTTHVDAHQDVAHQDSHADSGHSDSHTDAPHADEHFDTHTDSHDDEGSDPFHIDEHGDTHGDVHVDYHFDTHNDTPHGDDHNDHADTWHGDHDDHGDSPTLNEPTVVAHDDHSDGGPG